MNESADSKIRIANATMAIPGTVTFTKDGKTETRSGCLRAGISIPNGSEVVTIATAYFDGDRFSGAAE